MINEFFKKIFELNDKTDKKELIAMCLRTFALLNKNQVEDVQENSDFHMVECNEKKYVIAESEKMKMVLGEDYNYVFDKKTGEFKRWGRNYDDDPSFSPIGGEILDIEITTSCTGINGVVCPWCYKSNTPNGKNMSFNTFRDIINKTGKQLTQIAFGADSTATCNPELFKMADYCRSQGIIPNITVADVSDEIADKLVSVMGAVAVSRYEDKNVCYNSIEKLTNRGMKQVNMHFMLHADNYNQCAETLMDIQNDKRLDKLNAIVFLSLKQKGRGEKYSPMSSKDYKKIVSYCIDKKINFGMDSCSAVKFLDCVKSDENYEKYKMFVEPCESTNFSQYVDVNGYFYPCSFCEEIERWENGLNVSDCKDYLKEIWYNDKTVRFREKLNCNCDNCHKERECPIYKI